jgi:hypothetical protein
MAGGRLPSSAQLDRLALLQQLSVLSTAITRQDCGGLAGFDP